MSNAKHHKPSTKVTIRSRISNPAQTIRPTSPFHLKDGDLMDPFISVRLTDGLNTTQTAETKKKSTAKSTLLKQS